MRFVAVKSVETQGRAVAFRTHQCLVRQRTQLINALRGHLAEFGLVAPKGPASLKVLENALAHESSELPGLVREMGAIYVEQIAQLGATYGSVGAVVVLLIWLSWNVNAIFYGGAFATEMEIATRSMGEPGIEPDEPLPDSVVSLSERRASRPR
jgi:hypothetical protein